MFNNVVVGVRKGDPEAGRDAIALARQLVSTEGRLTLLRVQVVSRKPSVDSGSVREAQEREREIAALERFRAEAGLEASVDSAKGLSVARGIHAWAELHGADLIVIGSSRAGEIDRLLSGDNARDVIHGAPCRVAIAPMGWAEAATRGPVDLEVVGDDDRAIDHFLGLGKAEALADHPLKPLLVLPSARDSSRGKQSKRPRPSHRLTP